MRFTSFSLSHRTRFSAHHDRTGRTASEIKIKRAQGLSDETAQLTDEAFRFALGIDLASDTTHEAADRALNMVSRKLDKTLSVEYTVNELITEASDPSNLGLMYSGQCRNLS